MARGESAGRATERVCRPREPPARSEADLKERATALARALDLRVHHRRPRRHCGAGAAGDHALYRAGAERSRSRSAAEGCGGRYVRHRDATRAPARPRSSAAPRTQRCYHHPKPSQVSQPTPAQAEAAASALRRA